MDFSREIANFAIVQHNASMKYIYEHHLPETADNGIFIRELIADQSGELPLGMHMDNYYLFVFIDTGSLRVNVDFNEGVLEAHTCGFLEPGKVHQYKQSSPDAHGFIMGVDSSLLYKSALTRLGRFTFKETKFTIDRRHEEELGVLFPLLLRRRSKVTLPAFAQPVIAIFEEIATSDTEDKSYSRTMDIFLEFKTLVKKYLYREHKPSFYADKLNITSGYLNEVVNNVMYVSTQKYILSEIIMQARRELATSFLSIQQVADKLGYDDPAYFSRIFNKVSGMSPQTFRKKYAL